MKPHERLAKYLKAAQKAAREQVVRGRDLSQPVREFLVRQGCLLEVMKGWYFLVPPATPLGETALWHGNFWAFLGLYLQDRVGENYCLSAELSLDLQSGETRTPTQVTALLAEGGNNTITLRFADTDLRCSVLTYKDPKRLPSRTVTYRGLNLMPVGHALARVTPTYFERNREQAEVLLRTTDAAELANGVIEMGRESGAERVLGGLEALGMNGRADQVRGLIALTGWKKGVNPFPDAKPLFPATILPRSPCADRVRLLWEQMRPVVLERFPSPPRPPLNHADFLVQAHNLYQYDAYHSLSIEGFQVTPDLIARIEAGSDPNDPAEREENNRLAAKGYSLAHASVLGSIGRIFEGQAPGDVASRDLPYWYSELHRPFVQIGRLTAADLAGYRQRPVFLRGSMYVPPPPGLAVIDSMEAFFAALREEPDAAVRAVLGHFVFVYIHPFIDGNGRIGRFLMNAMLASGGYHWTILRVTRRGEYMAALERASINRDIGAFADFVVEEMEVNWTAELAQTERTVRKRAR
jgi:hypothetical protein